MEKGTKTSVGEQLVKGKQNSKNISIYFISWFEMVPHRTDDITCDAEN